MDVLVLWEDGSKNVVFSKELETIECTGFCVGNKVKMLYGGKWYTGTVLAAEDEYNSADDDSEDNIPLSILQKRLQNTGGGEFNNKDYDSEDNMPLSTLQGRLQQGTQYTLPPENENENYTVSILQETETCKPVPDDYADELCHLSDSPLDDSDADPTFGVCEVRKCKEDVWAACDRCQALVCFNHFHDDVSFQHSKTKGPPAYFIVNSTFEFEVQKTAASTDIVTSGTTIERVPESFLMDGEPREVEIVKKRRSNTQKMAKVLRNSGKILHNIEKLSFIIKLAVSFFRQSLY